MNQTVKDVITTELAKLTRLEPTPVEPFAYGVDTLGVSDWTDTLDEVDPLSVLGISEALLRRLQTPRGTLQDDSNYGVDLRAFLNRPTTSRSVLEITSEVRGEVLKDDRVIEALVTVTFQSQKLLRVKVDATPADPDTGGPFTLTLAVTSGAVLLEAINASP